MKARIFWGVAVLILLVVNCQIAAKEQLKASGRRVLLELAPVDPRSLMQGDYMILGYDITRRTPASANARDGHLVLAIDSHHVGRFERVHAGEPVAGGEQLLRYRAGWRPRVGAESFFFQEGDGPLYARARYGELRVSPRGEAVLVGLCDDALQPIRAR